ncbi:MAG: transposase zinc-binding domain-containing protein [Pseudomonadales bacterium]|nr:transposase zinc-binding domain-containing protein [Pseudomonadales bacterium]
MDCGRLENGFLRVRCDDCYHERIVAFSCKKRGFYPSCGASRMAQTAALLTDHILPHQPIRQYVLSLPFPLRFLLAAKPELIRPTLKIITHSIEKKRSPYTTNCSNRSGDIHTTIWQCFKPEYTCSHAIFGWCLCDKRSIKRI